jgi:hypothetical protein
MHHPRWWQMQKPFAAFLLSSPIHLFQVGVPIKMVLSSFFPVI